MSDTPSIPRPLQPCIDCGQPTPNRGQRCDAHTRTKNRKHRAARAYYHTTEWAGTNGLRAQTLQRDHHQCVICGRTGPQLTAHHIKARRDGGTDTLDNLATLCSGARGTCHNRVENHDHDAIAALTTHLDITANIEPFFEP